MWSLDVSEFKKYIAHCQTKISSDDLNILDRKQVVYLIIVAASKLAHIPPELVQGV